MKNKNWTFFKAGGVYQASIKSGEDIRNLRSLDRTLWAALSCPTLGLNFDKRTLEHLAESGHIRIDSVIDAAEWTCSLLKNSDDLLNSPQALKLDNINDSSPEGKTVKSFAKQILRDLGKGESEEISLEDVDDEQMIFANSPFNADGIITSLSCSSAEQSATLDDILKTCPPKIDRSGKNGVDLETVEKFYDDCSQYIEWLNKGKTLEIDAALSSCYFALEAKIEDFFTRCDILSFRPEAEDLLREKTDSLIKNTGEEINLAELLPMPLAKVNADKILRAGEANPAYSEALQKFFSLLPSEIKNSNEGELVKDEWKKIKTFFEPIKLWKAEEKNSVSALGEERISQILSQNILDEFKGLFEKEAEQGDAVANMKKVEKLVRLNAKLFEFLCNFVNFSTFYEGKKTAAFQFGRLYIDRRECKLCLKVNDATTHATMAPLSYTYLIYCNCKRAGMPDMMIASAMTSGDSQNLIVGRNGVFYDNDGLDWDATIVKIVENPISISQSFWAPYKRFVNWVSQLIAKQAASADEGIANKMTSNITAATATPPSGATTAAAPKKIDVGTVAALGVAVSGITAVFGMILQAFFGMGVWMPLGILGVILAISLPSMVMASMKLGNRNLGPILDANGWAVNTLARINIRFGGTLTKTASLPKGSKKYLLPSDAKRRKLNIFAISIICLAIASGIFAAWHFEKIKKEKAAQTENSKQTQVSNTPQTESANPSAPPAEGAK